MENDKDVIAPTADGVLEAKYRGWTELDKEVLSLCIQPPTERDTDENDDDDETNAQPIRVLNVSFNCIESIPEDIFAGRSLSLSSLVELDCSCNRLGSLPESIGHLVNLKVLKANGNRLRLVPEGLSRCTCLERLILSENELTSLPPSVAESCEGLRMLRLQTNRLTSLGLPTAIAGPQGITGAMSGPTNMEELDVSNNPCIDDTFLPLPRRCLSASGREGVRVGSTVYDANVDVDVRSDTGCVLWILGTHRRYAEEERIVEEATAALRTVLQKRDDEIQRREDYLNTLRARKHELLSERATIGETYLKCELRFSRVSEAAASLWMQIRRAVSKRIDDFDDTILPTLVERKQRESLSSIRQRLLHKQQQERRRRRQNSLLVEEPHLVAFMEK